MKKIKGFFNFPGFIAKRYLLSKGEPRFASFLTVVALLGVAIGVSALITVTSVMAGFSKDLETKLMGFNPHVTVTSVAPISAALADEIKTKFKAVKSVEPFVEGEAIAQSAGGEGISAMGAKVYGLKDIPERMYKNATLYWGSGVYGRPWWHAYINPFTQGVVVGNEMLYQIGAHPDFGDSVQLIAPFGGIDPLGNPVPIRREYKVAGGFKSGFFEYDVKHLLMPINEAAKLLKDQGRYGLNIMLWNSTDTTALVKELETFLGTSYSVDGWNKKNKRLFAALKLEKVAMSFLLGLIVVIASFSIVGVSLMIFFSKRRELAVLMAMGATGKKVSRIFLFHGGLIGLTGTLLGVALGLGACFVIAESNIVLPPSYYLDHLPVLVSPVGTLLVAIGGVLVSLFASYYPAKRALSLDPIELLRSE